MDICDKTGDIGIPHVWTDINWRKGLDCSHQILYKEKETEVPREYYGIQNISDQKIIHARDLRVAGLLGRFKGNLWLFQRAKRNWNIDNYDPQVNVWRMEQHLPDYPGADENGAQFATEGFWGFQWGFDGKPIEEQDVVQKRFSQTMMAFQDYSTYSIPPFLAYCREQGQACLKELGQLVPFDRRVQRLYGAMKERKVA